MQGGSLQDKVKQGSQALVRGQNGVLTEETPQTIQQLSGQAGLPAPPVDPMSAATVGANSHQQKMMGTPAQTQAAFAAAQDSTQTLQDATRRSQARSQATDQESQEKEKSQQLQQLGSLGDRVSDFMQGQRKALEQKGVIATDEQIALPTSSAQLQGLPSDPTQLTTLKDAAKAYLANPSDMKALLAINKALGRDPNSQVTPDEVQSLYESSTATLARSGADTVANSLTVADLATQPEFGYDLNSLSDLLEVPADQLGKMTVPELQEKMQELQAQQFSNVQVNNQKATSNQLGGAERQLAHQLGREQAAVGLKATEADVQRLDQAINNADTVTFNGQQYKVGDLLQDSTISGIITDYLNAPEGSPLRKQLEASEPELLKFIQSNKAVLDDAAKAMAGGTQQFKDIQTANQAVATVQGVPLPPELMKAINPDFGQLSAEKFDPNSSGLLQHLNSLPPDQAKTAATNVSSLVAKYPELAGQLAGLKSDEVAQLGLNLENPSPKLQAFINNQDEWNQIHNTDPKDVDKIVQLITGDSGLTPDKAQAILDTNKAASALGFTAPGAPQLDADGDGKVDSVDQLYQNLVNNTPKATLKDAISGKVSSYQPQDLESYSPSKPEEKIAWDKLKDAAMDGSISASDIANAGFTEDELKMIQPLSSKWGAQAKVAVAKQLQSYTLKRTTDLLDTIHFNNNSPVSQNISNLNDLVNHTESSATTPAAARDAQKSLASYIDQSNELIRQLEYAKKQQGSNISSDAFDAEIRKLQGFQQYARTRSAAIQAKHDEAFSQAKAKAIEDFQNNPFHGYHAPNEADY